MIKCLNCGAELKPHWVKCPKCKTPVGVEKEPLKCPACGEPLEEGWDECPACGAAQSTAAEKSGPLERANEFFEKEDYTNAVKELSEAVKSNPHHPAAYYSRGIAYILLEDYGKAVADFSKVISLDPSKPQTFEQRGKAYAGMEDYEHAVEDYNEAIRLGANDAYLYRNRGDAYFGIWKNLDQKEYDWEDYINADKDYYDWAIADYSEAIRLDPGEVFNWFNRGEAYRYKEDYGKAEADYSKVIKLDPEFISAYYWRGYIRTKTGNGNGQDDLAKAFESEPEKRAEFDALIAYEKADGFKNPAGNGIDDVVIPAIRKTKELLGKFIAKIGDG